MCVYNFCFKEFLNTGLVFLFLLLSVSTMVNEGKGTFFKRKNRKYLIYIPVDLAEDSMFPFKTNSAVPVKISFEVGDNKLKIEKWNEENK
jgi:hypothetical protein